MKTSKANSGRRKVGDRFIDLVPQKLERGKVYTYSQVAEFMGVSMKTIHTKMPVLRERKVIECAGFGNENHGQRPFLWRVVC